MIMSQLSQYLQTRHCASIADMAISLQATPEALKPMLHKLMVKGRVRALPTGSSCGHSGCCQCHPQDQQLYEWIGNMGEHHAFVIESAG